MYAVTKDRIEKMGRRLRRVVRALMLLTPLAAAAIWAIKGPLALVRVPREINVDPTLVTFPGSLAVVAVGLLEPATWLLGFVFLDQLFGLYARGIVFAPRNVALIRRAGWALVAIDGVRLLVSLLTGGLLKVLGATGPHLWFELQISTSMVGLFVVLISRVMDMGRELHENEELTI
jgi:hypothetical protein